MKLFVHKLSTSIVDNLYTGYPQATPMELSTGYPQVIHNGDFGDPGDFRDLGGVKGTPGGSDVLVYLPLHFYFPLLCSCLII